jgi:hypothetical protein
MLFFAWKLFPPMYTKLASSVYFKSPLKYDLVTGLFTRWVGDVLREHRPQKDILGL